MHSRKPDPRNDLVEQNVIVKKVMQNAQHFVKIGAGKGNRKIFAFNYFTKVRYYIICKLLILNFLLNFKCASWKEKLFYSINNF